MIRYLKLLAFTILILRFPGVIAAVDDNFYAENTGVDAKQERMDVTTEPAVENEAYDKKTISDEVVGFFGAGAETVAAVVEKMFKEHGKPNGYIKGEEAGGAFVFGLRYGHGELHLKDGGTKELYWQSPSVGFDFGGNAAKVFVLVYNLPNIDSIFQRYPGVEGSLYFVGGVGINYVQSGDIILAPMRFGVGWRAGASVGYMVLTRDKAINPF
jgi:hypothetical protein